MTHSQYFNSAPTARRDVLRSLALLSGSFFAGCRKETQAKIEKIETPLKDLRQDLDPLSVLRARHKEFPDVSPELIINKLSLSEAKEYRSALVQVAFGNIGPAPFTFDDNPFHRTPQSKEYAIQQVVRGTLSWLDALGADPAEARQHCGQILRLYVCAYTFLDKDRLEKNFGLYLESKGILLRNRGESDSQLGVRASQVLAYRKKSDPLITQEVYLEFCRENLKTPNQIKLYLVPEKVNALYRLWQQGFCLQSLCWHTVYGDHISSKQGAHAMHANSQQLLEQKGFFNGIIKQVLQTSRVYHQDAHFRADVDRFSCSIMRTPGGNGFKVMSKIDGHTPAATPEFAEAAKQAQVTLAGWTHLGDTSRTNGNITSAEALSILKHALVINERVSLLCHFHHKTAGLVTADLLSRQAGQAISFALQQPIPKPSISIEKNSTEQAWIVVPFKGTIYESLRSYYPRGEIDQTVCDLVLESMIRNQQLPVGATHRRLSGSLKSLQVPVALDQRLRASK